MLGEMAAVLSCTKAAVDLTKGMMSLKKDVDIQAKAIELNNVLFDLQQQLMNAQLGQMQLVERIRGLETELAAQNELKKLQERYALYRFPTGTYGYNLKPEFRGDEPDHYLCSGCFEKGQRVTMHARTTDYTSTMTCPQCKNVIEVDHPKDVPPLTVTWGY